LIMGRSYETNSVNISGCFFSRENDYSGDGGVICIKGGSYSIDIEISMYYHCTCNSKNSNLKMICTSMCSSIVGHYAIIEAVNLNIINYLSVSYSSKNSKGKYPICLKNGNQNAKNSNSSMNQAEETSGIYHLSPLSFESSFCSFSNNQASVGICIYFNSNSGTMSSINVVHNNSPNDYGVITNYNGSPKIKYGIFFNNQNTLLFIGSGCIDLSHSFISHTSFISTGSNNSITLQQSYKIQFFHSHYCIADNPIPIENTLQIFPRLITRFLFPYIQICENY